MKLIIRHDIEIDRWVKEHHYLQSVPAGSRVRMEFQDDDGHRIGAMLWGRPSARSIDQWKVLQLTRMFFVDDTEHCAESKALAMARKHIRKHLPEVSGLISYTSSQEGHKGTVYVADGWFPIGYTKNGGSGWENRPGRTNRDLSDKTKFARTP